MKETVSAPSLGPPQSCASVNSESPSTAVARRAASRAEVLVILAANAGVGIRPLRLRAAAMADPGTERSQWGKLVSSSANGRVETYELDFGNGNKNITTVTWADDTHGRGNGND